MSSIYGVVLAGGIGSRMGSREKPKQFLELGDKPIIVHTVEKFVLYREFEKVLVLSPRAWVSFTRDVLAKYLPSMEKVEVLCGGDTRNETIMNAVRWIEEQGALDGETIIVTHDAVRPFVTHRILKDNVEAARQYGACDTVIPATDTIVQSLDNARITDIPNRKFMYQGQTPQSFHAKRLWELYHALTEEEKEILTDACKILVLKGEHVHLVQGEEYNIKITYPYDLAVARTMMGLEKGEIYAEHHLPSGASPPV